MLSIQTKDNKIDFTFTDYFSKKKIHSESFSLEDGEQMVIDILKMIKDIRKENAQKDRNEVCQSPQKRCF
jgi:hypothetical protein